MDIVAISDDVLSGCGLGTFVVVQAGGNTAAHNE